jgi:hypothetical protein
MFGMVKSIKRGTGWARVELVDETGTIGLFHHEDTQIEPNQMYFILVGDNRIARYINVKDIDPNGPDLFVDYLYRKEYDLEEDDYDDAVAAFLAKNKPTVGKTHKPRKAERLGGSKHIGTIGGSGASKGRLSGLGANTGKSNKPVVTAEGEDEQPKNKPVVIKTNKPVGSRVADIGPGGKEYNVKTDKAWDDQHKEVDEAKADPTGSWVVYDGSKVKRFKTRDGAKAYAEKNGGKVASSEFYADNVQKQSVAETTSSGSVATSMGGGNGFVNGGPGTIARPKMKKKK